MKTSNLLNMIIFRHISSFIRRNTRDIISSLKDRQRNRLGIVFSLPTYAIIFGHTHGAHVMHKGFTLVELKITIVFSIIVSIIAIVNLKIARTNGNEMSAKAACATCMTEICSAQTCMGDLPTYNQLKDFIEPELYQQTAQHPADTDSIGHSMNVGVDYTGDLTNTKGYKAYVFSYLCSTTSSIKPDDPQNIDPTTRAIEALPKFYNCGGKRAFYRTSETGPTYEVDAKGALNPSQKAGVKIPFYTLMRYISSIKNKTWKVCK
jgi:hypothetical protein